MKAALLSLLLATVVAVGSAHVDLHPHVHPHPHPEHLAAAAALAHPKFDAKLLKALKLSAGIHTLTSEFGNVMDALSHESKAKLENDDFSKHLTRWIVHLEDVERDLKMLAAHASAHNGKAIDAEDKGGKGMAMPTLDPPVPSAAAPVLTEVVISPVSELASEIMGAAAVGMGAGDAEKCEDDPTFNCAREQHTCFDAALAEVMRLKCCATCTGRSAAASSSGQSMADESRSFPPLMVNGKPTYPAGLAEELKELERPGHAHPRPGHASPHHPGHPLAEEGLKRILEKVHEHFPREKESAAVEGHHQQMNVHQSTHAETHQSVHAETHQGAHGRSELHQKLSAHGRHSRHEQMAKKKKELPPRRERKRQRMQHIMHIPAMGHYGRA